VQAAKSTRKIADLAVPLADIPFVREEWGSSRAMHVLISGYQSRTGWVTYNDGSVVPPRRIRRLQPEDMDRDASKVRNLVVSSREWLTVPEDMEIKDVIAFLDCTKGSPGAAAYDDDAVIATTAEGAITGVLEVATLFSV